MLKQVFQTITFIRHREKLTEEFLQAGRDGDLDKIKSLLGQGIDVNARGGNCETALMCASIRGHSDCVAFLLDGSGLPGKIPADPNLVYDRGSTPLIEAAAHGKAEIVRLLIEAKADVNAKLQMGGETALMLAAANGRWDNTLLLLQAGADIHATGSWDRKQPRDFARDGGHPDVEQLLRAWSDGIRVFNTPPAKGRSAEAAAAPETGRHAATENGFRVMRPLKLIAREG